MEHDLSVAREQTNRSASSKLDHMLSVQKSPSDKTGLGFVESIFVPVPHSTHFVPSSFSEPHVSEDVKLSVSEAKSVEVIPPRKIKVDLHESKPKAPNPPKGKTHDKPAWVCHFCGSLGTFVQTITSCKLLREQINQKYLCLKHKILWYSLVNW